MPAPLPVPLTSALLPETVEFTIVKDPELTKMPPPLRPAQLLAMVLFSMLSAPEFQMPPPLLLLLVAPEPEPPALLVTAQVANRQRSRIVDAAAVDGKATRNGQAREGGRHAVIDLEDSDGVVPADRHQVGPAPWITSVPAISDSSSVLLSVIVQEPVAAW